MIQIALYLYHKHLIVTGLSQEEKGILQSVRLTQKSQNSLLIFQKEIVHDRQSKMKWILLSLLGVDVMKFIVLLIAGILIFVNIMETDGLIDALCSNTNRAEQEECRKTKIVKIRKNYVLSWWFFWISVVLISATAFTGYRVFSIFNWFSNRSDMEKSKLFSVNLPPPQTFQAKVL
jgi:hypothetical protein